MIPVFWLEELTEDAFLQDRAFIGFMWDYHCTTSPLLRNYLLAFSRKPENNKPNHTHSSYFHATLFLFPILTNFILNTANIFYPCVCGVTQERTKLIESHISNLKKEAKQHALSHFLCGLNIAHSGVHLQLLPISITSFAVQTWTDRNVFVHFGRHAAGLCECSEHRALCNLTTV